MVIQPGLLTARQHYLGLEREEGSYQNAERQRQTEKFWSSVQGCSQASTIPQNMSGGMTPQTHLASASVVHPVVQMQWEPERKITQIRLLRLNSWRMLAGVLEGQRELSSAEPLAHSHPCSGHDGGDRGSEQPERLSPEGRGQQSWRVAGSTSSSARNALVLSHWDFLVVLDEDNCSE